MFALRGVVFHNSISSWLDHNVIDGWLDALRKQIILQNMIYIASKWKQWKPVSHWPPSVFQL
jgi:hypothetical protein